jgi:hypothetical protein
VDKILQIFLVNIETTSLIIFSLHQSQFLTSNSNIIILFPNHRFMFIFLHIYQYHFSHRDIYIQNISEVIHHIIIVQPSTVTISKILHSFIKHYTYAKLLFITTSTMDSTLLVFTNPVLGLIELGERELVKREREERRLISPAWLQ